MRSEAQTRARWFRLWMMCFWAVAAVLFWVLWTRQHAPAAFGLACLWTYLAVMTARRLTKPRETGQH